jgi:uncharacterized protein (TIGR02646 family)
MRRVKRLDLDEDTALALKSKQKDINDKKQANNLSATTEWDNARKTKPLQSTLNVLKKMAGDEERCMYCLDSHATDIEHFWPKNTYPEKMFVWLNYLLCCTECNRFKSNQFPLDNEQPMLINPSAENPWLYLQYDSATGNLMARYDTSTNDWSQKGLETVKTLQLDKRQALSSRHKKAYNRLISLVTQVLEDKELKTKNVVDHLLDCNDYGLLDWCVQGDGKDTEPFRSLRDKYPDICRALEKAIQER